MKTLKGISICEGVSLGPLYIFDSKQGSVKSHSNILSHEKSLEFVLQSVKKAEEQVAKLKEEALIKVGQKEADIFDVHMLMLQDPMFLDKIHEGIFEEKLSPAASVEYAMFQLKTVFDNLEGEYFRERVADLIDISRRVIRIIDCVEDFDPKTLKEPVLIVAKELYPSQTIKFTPDKVIGIITEAGGVNSHAAILAKALEIPAVIGVKDLLASVNKGDFIILDSTEGKVLINPNKKEVSKYRKKMEFLQKEKENLFEKPFTSLYTKEGEEIRLMANIGGLSEIEIAKKYKAEGVGLFRTEFFFQGRNKMPTEDEQYEAYYKILSEFAPNPVIIRVLDIGADKELPYLNLAKEDNPALGLRGIRLLLKRTYIFKTQLRAVLRANVENKNARIMLPMVSVEEEVIESRKILKSVCDELGVNSCPMGIMIETPSAALIANELAKVADFFSIGSNDLIQYTLAIDRTNSELKDLFQPYHPAVLLLIGEVIKAGKKACIEVGLCGELAGDPKAIPILLKLGLTKFSMSAPSIPKAYEIINKELG